MMETSTPTSRRRGDDAAERRNDDAVLVHLESIADGEVDGDDLLPPAWSVEFVRNIQREAPIINIDASAASDDDGETIPSVVDIGLQLVGGTMERLSKKSKGNSATPTPVQLRLWPGLLHSFRSKAGAVPSDALNVVGIAPTGTGKTMAYATPIVSNCVRTLLCQARAPKRRKQSHMVHGLVLVPTRELAIQVSKESKAVAKVANKYLSKCIARGKDAGGATSSMKVKSIAVYGGVDIDSQLDSLLGRGESSSGRRSLVVAATAGRLLDILKQSASGEEGSAASAFADLRAVVFDEADRMAGNAEMAKQVDEILSILNVEKGRARPGVAGNGPSEGVNGVVSCLVSATLPEKAKEICDRWVPRSRVVVRVDNVSVGKKRSAESVDATKAGKCSGGEDGEGAVEGTSHDASEEGKERNVPQNLDLGSIPSNIVQTLHVCSNHKKPKKLVLTLQRIYLKGKNAKRERYSVNNRLCIVFFAKIKTVKYASKLLAKEGLRCVELYGSLDQREREGRLLEFKAGKTPILLATDVAARGLHVPNVHFVVNYDFPGSLDQYVHRCGRAGRKHALGGGGEDSTYPPTVYSFFPREFPAAYADSVVGLLRASDAWVDPNLLELTRRNETRGESSSKSSSKSGRKRKRRKNNPAVDETQPGEDGNGSDNEFSFLGKSVLKRASHVSDVEDSDDGSG